MPETETTQTTETTQPTAIVNPDGSFVENWHEGEAFKENSKTLSVFKTVTDLANSYVSTKKKYGKNLDTLVEIPTDTSSDEVKAAFRKARGVPDTVEGYEYTLSDEMAVKLGPLNDNKMTTFRDFAHKQGWNPKQFKDALDFYHINIASDIDTAQTSFGEQQTAAAVAAKAELRKRPGWQSEEEYTAKVQRAQSVLEKYDGLDMVEELNLQNSPKMLIFLDNFAESMSEDTLKGLAGPPVINKANIKARIDENRAKMGVIMKENPANYRGDTAFRELDKRNTELYKAFPA